MCMNCGRLGFTRMCQCSIPYFKDLILMAFTCDHCLHRTTEIKTGGGISPQATKYTMKIDTPEDLNRDLFKSESAGVEIPELGLELDAGSLGGVFSTVEGILEKVAFNSTRCSKDWRAIIHSSEIAMIRITHRSSAHSSSDSKG